MTADLGRIRGYIADHPEAEPRTVLEALGLEPNRATLTAVKMAKSADSGDPEGCYSGPNPGGNADVRTSSTPPEPDTEETIDRSPRFTAWRDVDFSSTDSGTYPPELLERDRWMGRLAGTKTTFAPWADRDHPDAGADEDARFKWGIADNYVDGHRMNDLEPAYLKRGDLDGRVFIQLEDDKFTHVDGDDVRCPETGDVHPAFIAILEHLGLTYADVSTSGSGIHAHYTGELPIGGKTQATIELDTEPWGANEEVPSVEFHAGKRLCVTTGEHVDGTPLELVEWDHDTLRCILEANGYHDRPEVSHDTDREREELLEYEPTATDLDETTEDVRDVLAAVDRLRPRHLPLQARHTGEDATGWETWDPSYRSSESGESVHRPPDESVFYDHKEGEAFGVLGLFAAEHGNISKPWDRLEGVEWWEAVDAAREAGAPIPEYVGKRSDPNAEPVAVLPPAVRDLTTAASGWDWRHAGTDTELTKDSVRDRTTAVIADAYDRCDRVLVEALPTTGKSHGAIKAAAETDTQITILTTRGRKEQYDQIREWCREYGLSCYVLPSFPRDCETAAGEHGEDWKETVMGWYNRGATPKAIHAQAEYVLGRPLPCQAHDCHRCPYASKWDFEPGDFDVLIGHPSHAYKRKVTTSRTVVFDEGPSSAFETRLSHHLKGAVTRWLKTTEGVPFDDYTGLLEGRGDETRRGQALCWFDERELAELDAELDVLEDRQAHAAAPIAVYALLTGEDLGNGFEYTTVPDVGVAAHNRENGDISVLRPPPLEYTRGVVCLDGTPTRKMWELAIGERLNHRQVLQDDELAEYLTDALNLNLVRTTEYVKPYNSTENVNVRGDAALLEAIADEHGKKPAIITTATAEKEYDREGALELVDDHRHYGNVKGSNEYADVRLGAVLGSNHYGDGFIKKWGAYAGEAVESPDRSDPENRGRALSYGGFGDRILEHMREHDTLQAVMRFGRDGNGAVVYVHTNTLPEWVPIAGEGRVLGTRSNGERQVLEAIAELDTWRTVDVTDHPAVDVTERRVFDILNDLAERGYLGRRWEGRGYTWSDEGLHEVNEHGEAELPPIDLEDLADAEVAEVSRNSIYTWKFRNPNDHTTEDVPTADMSTSTPPATPADGPGPPPDPAD